MSDAKEEKEDGHEAAPKGGGKKKLIIIIVAAVVLLGGGAGAFLAMSGGDKAAVEEEEKPRVLKTLPLDTFIANLADDDRSVYLKIVMVLEYDEEMILKASAGAHADGGGGGGHGGGAGGGGEKAGPPAIFTSRMPMIKDGLYRLISSKRSGEIRTSDGMEKLKEEILEVVNEAMALEEPAIVAVYFNEFIVQ